MCDSIGGKPCYVLTITDNVREDDVKIDSEKLLPENAPNKERGGYGSVTSNTNGQTEEENGMNGQTVLSGF